MARPTKLNDDMRNQIDEYISNCIESKKVPTTARLAVELGISKKTLYNWADQDKELLHTLNRLQSIQEYLLVEGSLEGKLNPTISKLMLANHGYVEKSEVDTTHNVQFINDVPRPKLGEGEERLVIDQ